MYDRNELRFHYKTKNGWVNDPNGLVFYKGEYHVFYQHCPHSEKFGNEPMHWGHAKTRDFLTWEELPVALVPDCSYDRAGCWSGTAIVREGDLYLVYTSVNANKEQQVSVAVSHDGIYFEKYPDNPVICQAPADGSKEDFRDPAVFRMGNGYGLVMATGYTATSSARLLLFESADLLHWQYRGILAQWTESIYAECPSMVHCNDKFLLTASVLQKNKKTFFSFMYGDFVNDHFVAEQVAQIYKGPDQYAGQIFTDANGRNILISWLPGWEYANVYQKDIGCMSLPCEITVKGGRIYAYPVKELQPYLKDSDPAVEMQPTGVVIHRKGREAIIHHGAVRNIKIMRDAYILEVFVNGGEYVYTAVL